ncbi:MAG: transmembrane anchor protein [Alphaproteobacteria bacterium]|nr:transmembrane anchor protein [Alphaproteobacteria bacterium]
MFNAQRPNLEDLPTSRQLIRATLIAAASAGALLVVVVLPSEYGVDATGAGRALGLTQMGEIKMQLADEAARDAAVDAAASEATGRPASTEASTGGARPATAQAEPDTPSAAASRNDTTRLTLAPGQGAEIKLTATQGTRIAFDWSVEGGRVNYDTHADAPGISYHGYGKGRESTGERGELVAAFDGSHGWFWRNRSGAPVTITLRTQGAYGEVKRVV